MITLFKLLSGLPLGVLHALGWLGGWLTFVLSADYRQRLLAQARQAGLAAPSWLSAVGASGQLVAELPRLWLGRPVPVLWDGVEHVQSALLSRRGVLFLTPHLGCFEITAQAYAQRFGAQAPMTVLYRPSRKAWLRALVGPARQRPGLTSAPTTLSGVKQMIKALKQGESVGLLPDQVPPLGMGLWAPFFGRDAYTMTLSVRLVQQTGAAVLLAWGERLSWGRGYCVHVVPLPNPLSADLPSAVADINQAMETLVRQCPGQYLWGYARYKQPRES
ncbi:MAG: lipid A biosynthesis acyltransferase [Comamonadaceae bacterium CG1_02_60_18]|nr:MAG: lipid A biosynthesis acyltransferase [Comamonadaceae bacterium CG1_02_60_18]PIQ50482.1 MAG: lipid A biosynthesis acyltransferase [Comamonadaceae bacterium CG12_big_fil_rev_8_21_14_0_65_59_15]